VAEEMNEKAKGRGGVQWIFGDISATTSVRSVAKTIKQQYNRLDVLINNAAVYNDKGYHSRVVDLPN
jgi:NAD(P)-dependent dehydrogenase (short-subunit alcohol dehydrogenase family)